MKRYAIFSAVLVVLGALTACQDTDPPVAPSDNPLSARSPHAPQEIATLFRQTSPEILALPQTVFAAHDEAAGVLVVGVENSAAAAAVQNALARRGVPASAYRIRLSEPIHFMSTTLRSEHRPTVGGLQIHWSSYVCTLGFNVGHAGGRSFITNSHCTDRQGTTGNTLYNQPLRSESPNAIAVEADDPGYARIPGCSAGKVCRYSDAARALYYPGATSTQGVIARTNAPNNGSLAVVGDFTISAQDNTTTAFARGATVNKVGRTTGWGQGEVTSSCATVNVSGSSIQLLCQTLVQRSGSVIVQGGDSGSPVFSLGSNNNVTLIGILWGGNTSGDLFVFSPLKNVQDELGSVTATAGGGSDGPPGTPPLQADFTYNCGNGPSCTFTDASSPAGVATSFSWSFPGGSPVSDSGPSASTTYSAAGTYSVTLTASGNGQMDTETKEIQCRLQGRNLRCR
jgi:hypothetical protein